MASGLTAALMGARKAPRLFKHTRRILHVTDHADLSTVDGRYIDSLTKALLPHGVESHLAYGQRQGALPDGLSSHVRLQALSSEGALADTQAGQLRDTVEALDPDLVCVHRVHDASVIRALDGPRRERVLLWHIHDHEPGCLTGRRAWAHEHKPVCERTLSEDCLRHVHTGRCRQAKPVRSFGVRELQARLGLLQAARRVDAIVVASDFMKQTLARHLPDTAGRIHVLPRPLPFLPAGTRTWDDGEAATVGYSGDIGPEGGLHVAIEALGHLRSDEAIVLRIAGTIRDSRYWWDCLKAAREAELRNPFLAVRHAGALDRHDLGAFYARTRILLVPSLWADPLCAVTADALRHAVAVIASDTGAIRTCVRHGETGLLVPPGQPAALAHALDLLLEHPEYCDRLARNGKRFVDRDFTPHRHLEGLSAAIDSCRRVRRAG